MVACVSRRARDRKRHKERETERKIETEVDRDRGREIETKRDRDRETKKQRDLGREIGKRKRDFSLNLSLKRWVTGFHVSCEVQPLLGDLFCFLVSPPA